MGLFSNYTDGGASVAKEMKRNKMTGWRDVAICIVLIIVVMIFFDGNRTVKPVIEKTTFTITGLEDSSISFRYEDIDSVEMRFGMEDYDIGEKIEGNELRKCICGTYRNAELGEYQLYSVTNVTRFIILHLSDGQVVVFNGESEETVEAMYNFLTEKSAYAKEELEETA